MTPLDPAAVRLFDEAAEVRREAVEAVDVAVLAGCYALRQALLGDEDAEVRSSAARRLGETRDRRFAPALIEALSDPMPSVRDRAWRALARLGARELLPAAERAVHEEPVWWVRRAAVRAAASVVGAEALALLLRILEDPFWRVRNAAVQALLWLGEGDAQVRQQVRSAGEAAQPGPVKAAAAYLEGIWSTSPASASGTGVGVPAPVSAGTGLEDEDPAVVTARLERMPASEVPPVKLVEWLGDPHEPLRALARRRLIERRDPEAVRLAMRWLDEPRVPHAAEEVRTLLERIDVDALSLASRILDEPPRPGAVAWAAQIAVKRDQAELIERVRVLCRHAEPDIRRAALSGLAFDPASRAEVLSALEDPDASVREEVIAAWERRPPAPSAIQAFGRALVAFAPRASTPRERRAVAEGAGSVGDEALLAHLSTDADASVRAVALGERSVRGSLSDVERREALSHEDPWIRTAVLDVASARGACEDDAALSVRRAALSLLTSGDAKLSPEERGSIGLASARSQDPWMQARGAELLVPERKREELEALLRLSRASSPMVRSAAAAVLEECESLDALLTDLLRGAARTQDSEVRASAYTWLLRRADPAAFEFLCAALRDASEPGSVVAHLEAMTLVFPDEAFTAAPDIEMRRPTRQRQEKTGPKRPAPELSPRASWRPLGNTGLSVSPLVVSGANGLSAASLTEAYEAGVNSFFWEPDYTLLTRFLRTSRGRREELVLVAGTYHSGAAAIRRDVESALRQLRTDWLDVFLLFWVRSPERLNPEDFETLEALRAEGKLRAFGFSTHLRDLAVEAIRRNPWPVVMTRHSAAHPGAEAAFFPEALARGTGVLTFTATCYGRLLRPVPGMPSDSALPSAVDCYRYSLTQPGVSACLTAPRSHRELLQNLEVLSRPHMVPEALEAMRAHGARVRARNQQFNALVRQAPGGTRDTFLELLEEDEAPPT
ncbi:HEAT repeat domain-containing protein [Hyalangium versicolor]|uniref:HEAT repeat domain-containing protein n=1 Tax=Hyalangium versicolor TaxID=2861190 RepID=UPI001CCCC731|nr:HEAT repeat domain-containing protein [Hyalangium versicolor]